MTKQTAAEIRSELHAHSQNLNDAHKDAATFERLRAASGEVTRLTKLCETLTATLAKAMEVEVKAERAAAHAPFKNMTISADDDGRATGLLSTRFIIQYDLERYDFSDEPTLVPVKHIGFGEMTDAAYRYMLEAKPELIPHSIMQLAPDNPRLAFERYFTAQRRGYLTNASLAVVN
jgi:hypothetical protein